MCKKLYRAKTPSKVLVELNRASSILRDVFNDSFTGIHVDDDSNVACTSPFSIPSLSEIFDTISAFVILQYYNFCMFFRVANI